MSQNKKLIDPEIDNAVEDKPICIDCHVNPPTKISLKLALSVGGLIALFIFSYLFPPLHPLFESLKGYFNLIWWAVLLGLVLGGLIDYFIPDEFIFKYLGKRNISSLFFALIGGFLLSACSHGILAIAIQLYKKGAGVPAVITFLLASPWANVATTVLLFSFFGIKALLFIGAALVIAFITGLIFILLDKKGLIEKSTHIKSKGEYNWNHIKNFNFKNAIKGTAKGTLQLANMVLWWIIIGFTAAAAIQAFVPHHIFTDYLGPNLTGLLLTLLAATIIEICSEGSSPIAFEVFQKTGALGNPFVFLMAGVATDYTEIGLLWTNIGRRTALWLPIITVPQILAVGIALNYFL